MINNPRQTFLFVQVSKAKISKKEGGGGFLFILHLFVCNVEFVFRKKIEVWCEMLYLGDCSSICCVLSPWQMNNSALIMMPGPCRRCFACSSGASCCLLADFPEHMQPFQQLPESPPAGGPTTLPKLPLHSSYPPIANWRPSESRNNL